MRQFLFEYTYDNATYGLVIPADDEHEARGRAHGFSMTRQYKGEVMATVKVANSGNGWWARFVKFVLGVRS